MKGYPKSRFDIINQTQVQTIETTGPGTPTALYMQPYTSNKGTEDWELLTELDGFTDAKGSISFTRHGQAQLNIAKALSSGAYVLGKRLVSEDATLANITLSARLVKVDDITYVYFYTKSAIDCKTFEEVCKAGYGNFDHETASSNYSLLPIGDEVDGDEGNIESGAIVTDIPLFTIAPMGRGESLLFFRITPTYVSSRKRNSSTYMKYTLEIIEDNEVLESIVITMNPEIVIDGVAQGINPKVRDISNQIRIKSYDDGIYALVSALAKTAVDENGNAITGADLLNMDFVNGYDRSGTVSIGGIVTITQNADSEDSEWVANKPFDIQVVSDLASPTGIHLVNGTFGTMGRNPMSNPEEMEKMLLAALGKDQESILFDSIIYDLDAYKIDAIFDANWPATVKNAIIDLVDFRGDMVFLCDLGTSANTLELIKEAIKGQVETTDSEGKVTQKAIPAIQNSSYVALYHNYFKILDPFSKKEITVTMPYMLIDKLTSHIVKGVGRPFAGIANNIYFTDIIENSVNFYPVEIPGSNQKQELVDVNINYLSLYDGIPVMETMYVNDSEYSQLSYLHNIMAIQEIIKIIRTRCPRTRYTFLDGDDLETYISDVQAIIKEYSTNFKSISCEYMADQEYEENNIFYAVLKVQFKNFIQEEYFKIIAINS